MAGALSRVMTPKQLETARAKTEKRLKERKSAAMRAGQRAYRLRAGLLTGGGGRDGGDGEKTGAA